MSFSIKNKVLKAGEVSYEGFSQVYVETDVIVPDIKPDIIKILQTDMRPVVTNYRCQNNKLLIDGEIYCGVIYLADSAVIKSINTVQSFNHAVNIDSYSDDMTVFIQCEMESAEHKLINSRKFSLKALVGLDISAERMLSFDVPIDIEDEENCCYALKNPFKTYSKIKVGENSFSVKESLEVPNGKPSIAEVLNVNVAVRDAECKSTGGKLMLQGKCSVYTLYCSDEPGNTIEYMEHEFNFSEIIELFDDNSEYSKFNLDFFVFGIDSVVLENSDGDNRILLVEPNIKAVVKCDYCLESEFITDIYSTKKEIELEKKKITLSELIEENQTQISIKDTLMQNGNLEIVKVYNVSAKPHLSGARYENSSVFIDGVLDIDLMCITGDVSNPICNLYKEIPFSHTMAVSLYDDDIICDVDLSVDHVSYNMNLGGEVDLRAVLAANVKMIKKQPFEYIVNITENEIQSSDSDNGYYIRVYFVSKGDTFWEIAKKYRVTVDDIMRINGFETNHELKMGQKIVIPF